MTNRAKKEDLYGQFDPVVDAVLKALPSKDLPAKLKKGAEQPNSRTAEQPNSRTAEQPNSRTAEQPNSRTAEQPNKEATA